MDPVLFRGSRPSGGRVEYVGVLYHVMDRGDREEQQAVRLIAPWLKAVGLAAGDLQAAAKGDPRQIAIAAVASRRTIMQNEWTSRRLEMGGAARVSRYCSDAEGRAEVRRLMRKIETAICKD